MTYGDECTDLVSVILTVVETEEGQMMNNEIYRYVGAVV